MKTPTAETQLPKVNLLPRIDALNMCCACLASHYSWIQYLRSDFSVCVC